MSSEHITFLAATNYRGLRHPFGIKRDDRRRHMYMIGKTGMGKSTLLVRISVIVNTQIAPS